MGQKGSFRFPLKSIEENVKYILLVDRMSSRHENGQRHFVHTYQNVPLVPIGEMEGLQKVPSFLFYSHLRLDLRYCLPINWNRSSTWNSF